MNFDAALARWTLFDVLTPGKLGVESEKTVLAR